MKSDTSKTHALIKEIYDETGHVGQDNCPEKWVKLCREIEEINEKLTTALKDCVSVMEAELRGLAVIQPELRQAKEALISNSQMKTNL